MSPQDVRFAVFTKPWPVDSIEELADRVLGPGLRRGGGARSARASRSSRTTRRKGYLSLSNGLLTGS